MYDVNKYKCYAYDEKRPDGTKCPVCVAISTYAGKTVKGIAKCDPNDNFSYDYGKKLAKARCDVKISRKRYKNADSKLKAAYEALIAARIAARKYYNKMFCSSK